MGLAVYDYYIQYIFTSLGVNLLCMYVCVFVSALQYTTAHLQVLCSLQHLGGILRTKITVIPSNCYLNYLLKKEFYDLFLS